MKAIRLRDFSDTMQQDHYTMSEMQDTTRLVALAPGVWLPGCGILTRRPIENAGA